MTNPRFRNGLPVITENTCAAEKKACEAARKKSFSITGFSEEKNEAHEEWRLANMNYRNCLRRAYGRMEDQE